ncbi:MAG: VRR-NUC domain-containing protein [Bacilli bacterium]
MDESRIVKNIIKHIKKNFPGSFFIKTHGGPFQVKGLPDIMGCYKGVFIGLEVKVPGRENTVTDFQIYRINQINTAGGFATVVTSVGQAIDFVKSSVKNF